MSAIERREFFCRACGTGPFEEEPEACPKCGHLSFRRDKFLTCACGREVMCNEFTNTCDCGLEYNHAGQRLAPRCFWGEETGETAADILTGGDPFGGDGSAE
ncbi:MAG TPA: hypothetical protein PLC99_14125 [Verrucomicrobiota bacterium]|nr:hypothetical protein [Verrucomicrobiota bacterium]